MNIETVIVRKPAFPVPVVVANCAVAVATFPDATSATNVIVCVADCPASRLVLTFTVPEGATVVPLTVTRICAAPVVRVLNCDEISMRNVHEAAEFWHFNFTGVNTTTGVVESATVLEPTTILVRLSFRGGDGNVARGTTRSLYGSPDWANAGPFPEQASARSRAKPPIPTLVLVTAFLPGVCAATSICIVLFALSNLRPPGVQNRDGRRDVEHILEQHPAFHRGKNLSRTGVKGKVACLQVGEGPVRFPKSVRAWPQFQGRVSYLPKG